MAPLFFLEYMRPEGLHLLTMMTLARTLSLVTVAGLFAFGCSSGGGNDNGDDVVLRPDSRVNQNVCGDDVCSPSEIGSCDADCGSGPQCNNNSICDAGEVAATCADCMSSGACDNDGICDAGENATTCDDCQAVNPCNNNGTCEGGETPTNCAADCTVVNDCGGCAPDDTMCVTDFCGMDQGCLTSCLSSGFDCASLICPALGISEPLCSIFCSAFGG